MQTNIVEYKITRFQYLRDRPIGDAKVFANEMNVATLELIDEAGRVGLGFIQSLFTPLPTEDEICRLFEGEVWPKLKDQPAAGLAHRVTRPRGGQRNATCLPFEEAIQQAVWDLTAKSLNLPLWKLLGARKDRIRGYASGLDFHLSDDDFCSLFERAKQLGFTAFKIKVGHEDLERDVHRLNLLSQTVGSGMKLMVDANESWTVSETLQALNAFRKEGHEIYWIEDPILREDFQGLRELRTLCNGAHINAGEYFSASGKCQVLEQRACDMLNVHGYVSDVMRTGWLAAEKGIPVTIGNTFLEIGVNMGLALPETNWMEYSFQNYDHLVEDTFKLVDGYFYGSEKPGHGLVLSEDTRKNDRVPAPISNPQQGPLPKVFS